MVVIVAEKRNAKDRPINPYAGPNSKIKDSIDEILINAETPTKLDSKDWSRAL